MRLSFSLPGASVAPALPVRLSLLLITIISLSAPPAHALSWQPLGAGIGGTRVTGLYVWGGLLVATGEFSSAGGAPAHNIAVWDGSAWSTLGDGFDLYIAGVAEFNSQLVVSGTRPGQPSNELWTWDGGSWVKLSSETHSDLVAFQGDLFGTSFFNYGPGGLSTGTRIHKYDGVSWSIFATLTSGVGDDYYYARAMENLGGQLAIIMEPGGFVSAFDGASWTSYPGAGYFPAALGTWNGALIAAGNDMGAVPFVKEWTGSGWVNHAAGFGELCAGVAAVTEHEGQLIAAGVFGGGFDPCDVPGTGHRVLSFDGAPWATAGAAMNNAIHDVVVYDGELVAAGDFTGSGGVSTPLIARYTDAPVPVAISRFSAQAVLAGVELTWEIASDEAFDGFDVYRAARGRVERANAALLPAGDRSYVDRSVVPGEHYTYELAVVDQGVEVRSAPVAIGLAPLVAELQQNSPNPFNPSTSIRYTVSEPGHVSLRVYAPDGRTVRTLVDGHRPAGRWTVNWDGKDAGGNDVATGIYLYRLQSGKTLLSRKMVLIK